MGSPLAPILSDILLEHAFEQLIPQFPVAPDFLYKYVDDTICSLPPETVEDTLSILNSYHPRIKFTMEIEKDNTIPFLDLLLIKQRDNSIITNWYSKSTSSGSILNYLSSHPHHQKLNVASNLTNRILHLSHKQFHRDNTDTVKNILSKNNYPTHIINKILKKSEQQFSHTNQISNSIQLTQNNSQQININLQSHSQQQQHSQQTEQNQPQQYYSSLTYIPQLSDKIRNIIKYNNPDTKLAFKSTKTIKSNILSKTKQKINKLQQSAVIYKINCDEENCPVSYVGETKRQLSTRRSEHERDYRNRLSPTPKTGLVNHCLESGHIFNFDDIQILDKEKNVTKRRIIESSHIMLNDHTCNLKNDISNINVHYINTLHTYKSLSPKFTNRSPNISETSSQNPS